MIAFCEEKLIECHTLIFGHHSLPLNGIEHLGCCAVNNNPFSIPWKKETHAGLERHEVS